MNIICFMRFGQSLGSSKHISNSCLLNLTDFRVSSGTISEIPSSGGRRLTIWYFIENNFKSFEITRNQGGGWYHSSFTSSFK